MNYLRYVETAKCSWEWVVPGSLSTPLRCLGDNTHDSGRPSRRSPTSSTVSSGKDCPYLYMALSGKNLENDQKIKLSQKTLLFRPFLYGEAFVRREQAVRSLDTLDPTTKISLAATFGEKANSLPAHATVNQSQKSVDNLAFNVERFHPPHFFTFTFPFMPPIHPPSPTRNHAK